MNTFNEELNLDVSEIMSLIIISLMNLMKIKIMF